MSYYVATVYVFIYYGKTMTSSISVEIHGMQINDYDDDNDSMQEQDRRMQHRAELEILRHTIPHITMNSFLFSFDGRCSCRQLCLHCSPRSLHGLQAF